MSRAPILSWFAECVQGIDSVRAFDAAPRVAKRFDELVDANTRPKFCFFVSSRWIGLRLDLLCCLVTLAAALFRFDPAPAFLHVIVGVKCVSAALRHGRVD